MKRLIINLNNTVAWFEDSENKTLTVMSEGAASTFEMPDIFGVIENVKEYYSDPTFTKKLE